VAFRVGVICQSCRRNIEVEDEYIPGLRTVEMAAALYQPIGTHSPDSVNVAWRGTMTCGNPDCGKTHGYRDDDLLLYDG